MVFFHRGVQIRSRHTSIALSVPKWGAKLHCEFRWGAMAGFPPPWIRHCLDSPEIRQNIVGKTQKSHGTHCFAERYKIGLLVYQLQWIQVYLPI